jgi:predicted aconitase with swiveling domain
VEHIEFIKSRRTEKTRAIPRKPNLLFFQSSLGFFGHLDADTGLIEERHEVEKGETIINTNQNVLGIASESGQLILYDKETLVRRVDNRLLRETLTHKLHSYL